MSPSLTTDESALYAMPAGDLATHGRAAQQFAAAADRALADFTVRVLMLPPGSSLDLVRRAATEAGLIPRAREIIAAVLEADEVMRAYLETLRRRGIRS